MKAGSGIHQFLYPRMYAGVSEHGDHDLVPVIQGALRQLMPHLFTASPRRGIAGDEQNASEG
jgi:hypothetical protein